MIKMTTKQLFALHDALYTDVRCVSVDVAMYVRDRDGNLPQGILGDSFAYAVSRDGVERVLVIAPISSVDTPEIEGALIASSVLDKLIK